MNYRYSDSMVQDALAVVGQGIAQDYGIRVRWHDGGRVSADVENRVVNVPRLAAASPMAAGNADFLTALMLTRSNVAHEFGHCGKTKLSKAQTPQGALFSILNALEDVRMERAVAEEHPGYAGIFDESNRWVNKDIANAMLDGKIEEKPLWEALTACIFQSQGIRPAWNLRPQAQKYFDAAYAEFVKVLNARNTADCLVLAKRIYDLLKQVLKEEQEQQQPQPQQGGQGQDSDQQDSEQKQEGKQKKQSKKQQKQDADDEQDGDNDAGPAADMDREEPGDDEGSDDGEDKDGEGEEGDKDEDKSDKKNGKSKKADKDEEGDEDGEGQDGDEGDDDKDGDGEGQDGDKDGEEGDEDGEGAGQDGEEGDDEQDGKNSGKGQDADDKDGEDGEEGDSKGQDGEGDDDGEGQDGESQGGSDSDADGEAQDGEGDEEANRDGDQTGCNDGDKQKKGEKKADASGDKQAKNEAKGKGLTPEEEAEMAKRLAEEGQGQSIQEMANDAIEQAMKEMEKQGDVYTSRRDKDEHRVPASGDHERKTFGDMFDKMQQEVAAMSLALEQALRALTKCRKDSHLRRGRLDGDRLVEIAKNLSRDVFFKTRQGRELDTVVSLVIDQSASMRREQMYAKVRDLSILLGECMSRLGIPFEIIGTTTKYEYGHTPGLDGFTRTNPIVYDHYKSFEEMWPQVRARLVHMGGFSHNIDGEAVEYAAMRVAKRPEARKIVFSLCDGEPCGGQGNDDELGENIKRVSKMARKAGIEVYGVGIGTNAPAAFYGKQYFIGLNQPDSIGQEFVRIFATILTQGEVRV